MNKWFGLRFWETIARVVLRNKILMLVLIAATTALMVAQWKNVRFSFTEANLLPADDPANVAYGDFLDKFGEEGNLVIIGLKDSLLFRTETFGQWQAMMKKIGQDENVDLIVDVHNLRTLSKNDSLQRFEMTSLPQRPMSQSELDSLRHRLFNELPFYEGLLYNETSQTVRGAIYLKKDIVNTPARKDFILETLLPATQVFAEKTGHQPHISGMPYIRTMNTETIKSEIGMFILASLGVTSLLFFMFFRSFRATAISIVIVIIGVLWSFGLLGLFNYEITVLTALVPALMIVIGVPNCIFLTNKYHQEYRVHGNKVKALQRVTTKIGMATLMTNVTTAIGFATFVTSNNKLLIEFGVITAINILVLFVLSLVIIPIFHSYVPAPKPRHIKHLESGSVQSLMIWILNNVKYHRFRLYCVVVGLLILGVIGISQMRISGSLIEDMPRNTDFFDDILFFEREFNGVMPLEIVIDTKQPKGALKRSTMNRLEEFESEIASIPELSKPLSGVSLAKYAKQTYYNGNPDFYDLPTVQEQSFIMPFLRNSVQKGNENLLKSYIDSTGRYARITTFMRDDNGENIPRIEAQLKHEAAQLFPPDRFDVNITGKSLVFQKGTSYLLDNLLSSLLFAFFLTSLLVAFMFRSLKMVAVSLIPNLLPLLLTAGIMGFLDIPLKPSTILVFGIAFGLSVDDTIRFLAQLRGELKNNHWKIRKSVYATFNDAGLSMFYTSIVLFFGFAVFMLSDFGGTVALGGLVSLTLLCGMLSNLMLLPSLVLTLNKSLANKEDFIEPKIDIIEHTDEEIDNLPGHRELSDHEK